MHAVLLFDLHFILQAFTATFPLTTCELVVFGCLCCYHHCLCVIRLGPANTRLMQAYFQFDDRFAVLVPFVRLWVKYNGPPRSQLNNYTVSLLLIYALQRSQPPVLPCLQNPGSWPKNMAWFTKHGFASSLPPSFAVGPWNCDFVPPESLLPSTNTQSAGKHI